MHTAQPDTANAGLSMDDHRQAYNSAFEEMSLPWYWDSASYARFHGREGVRAYLQSEHAHLLRAYEADFLVDAVEAAKARCLAMMARGRQGAAPDARAAGAHATLTA